MHSELTIDAYWYALEPLIKNLGRSAFRRDAFAAENRTYRLYILLRYKFSHLSRYESNKYACHSRGAFPRFIGGF